MLGFPVDKWGLLPVLVFQKLLTKIIEEFLKFSWLETILVF
jgi:hypothetical protein